MHLSICEESHGLFVRDRMRRCVDAHRFVSAAGRICNMRRVQDDAVREQDERAIAGACPVDPGVACAGGKGAGEPGVSTCVWPNTTVAGKSMTPLLFTVTVCTAVVPLAFASLGAKFTPLA